MTVSVLPAGPERWNDVVAVLGGPRPRTGSCWCRRFLEAPGAEDRRAALRAEIDAATTPIGLLAAVDDVPAGWTRVAPRRSLPGVTGNRALQRLLEPDDRAWWVACVVVRREFRGAGIGAALLRGAADHARANGAGLLDGHPVDVERLAARPSPSALFTGTLAMFRGAGFVEIGRTFPTRPVLRRTFP